jgi:hypothetical protein
MLSSLARLMVMPSSMLDAFWNAAWPPLLTAKGHSVRRDSSSATATPAKYQSVTIRTCGRGSRTFCTCRLIEAVRVCLGLLLGPIPSLLKVVCGGVLVCYAGWEDESQRGTL